MPLKITCLFGIFIQIHSTSTENVLPITKFLITNWTSGTVAEQRDFVELVNQLLTELHVLSQNNKLSLSPSWCGHNALLLGVCVRIRGYQRLRVLYSVSRNSIVNDGYCFGNNSVVGWYLRMVSFSGRCHRSWLVLSASIYFLYNAFIHISYYNTLYPVNY